jgi:serine/threonine protein kinase
MPDVRSNERTYALIMELGGLTLTRRLTMAQKDPEHYGLTDRQRLEILTGIASGLAYLHNSRPIIVHRDIKTDNVILDHKNVPKLIDFGLAMTKQTTTTVANSRVIPGSVHSSASASSDGSKDTRGGYTLGYAAPEVLTGEFTNSSSQDIYSFGIVMLEVLSGKPAWNAGDDIYKLVVTENKRPNIPESGLIAERPLYANIMRACWSSDYKQRPSANQIFGMLETELCAPIIADPKQ